jgi:hypothetical protein
MPNPATTHDSVTGKRPRRHLLCALFAAPVFMALAALGVWHYAQRNARGLAIRTLEHRLHCKVEIDQLHLSLSQGVEVSGSGLRIESIESTEGQAHLAVSGVPMLTVEGFHLRTTLAKLILQRPNSIEASVHGVVVTIPPAAYSASKDSDFRSVESSVSMLHSVAATDARLILETGLPHKPPIEFDFREITLTGTGRNKPFAFYAVAVEPPPFGIVHATGHLGPWSARAPRQTPVDGAFRVDRVDMAAEPGLRGTLARFAGTIGFLTGDATADSPDFALDIGAHPVPLHAQVHLAVDHSTGDVTFNPATIHFLHTTAVATGTLSKTLGIPGHNTDLNIAIEQGREEDILTLLSKTKPLIDGALTFHGRLSVPPGTGSVSVKSRVTGMATIRSVIWNDPKLQQFVDSLSLRAQAEPKAAKAAPPIAPASLTEDVDIHDGILHATHIVYTLPPGATIVMDGTYPLTSDRLNFHGVARTAAKASEMTTGIKSLLLKPIDPMLGKHGAGTEVPVRLTGDKTAPKFGLDLPNRSEDKRKTEAIPTLESKSK